MACGWSQSNATSQHGRGQGLDFSWPWHFRDKLGFICCMSFFVSFFSAGSYRFDTYAHEVSDHTCIGTSCLGLPSGSQLQGGNDWMVAKHRHKIQACAWYSDVGCGNLHPNWSWRAEMLMTQIAATAALVEWINAKYTSDYATRRTTGFRNGAARLLTILSWYQVMRAEWCDSWSLVLDYVVCMCCDLIWEESRPKVR